MLNDDSIDILLMLEKGFTILKIFINTQLINILITHAFHNPYEELMKALRGIINGQKETECFLYDEPGGVKMEFHKSENNKIRVKINRLEDEYYSRKEAKENKIIADFIINEYEFLIKVYFQLKKIFYLLKNKDYSKDRGGRFPFDEYNNFEKTLKKYIGEIK